MAKAKTQFVCSDCGSVFPKWAGQCADCGAWNTLTEFNPDRGLSGNRGGKASWAGEARKVTTMAQVNLVEEPRTPTGTAHCIIAGAFTIHSARLVVHSSAHDILTHTVDD